MNNMPDIMNDSLGLGKLGGFDLSTMLEPVDAKFQEINLNHIREDGENPRNTFDQDTLEELAETVRARGVITPISVRPDPEREGEFIVNHGHRRLRAAKLAGLETIPAVIDDSFRDEDRIIENIQRDNLDMFDVAQFIAKKIGEGLKKKDVAKLIGKSPAYVTQHVQLLELPTHTAKAVRGGRITDLSTIGDLAKTEKRFPESVELFLAGDADVTRTAVRKFRDDLENPAPHKDGHGHDKGQTGNPEYPPRDNAGGNKDEETTVMNYPEGWEPEGKATEAEGKTTPTGIQEKDGGQGRTATAKTGSVRPDFGVDDADAPYETTWHRGLVIVEMQGKRGALLLDKRPRSEEYVWVEWEDGEEAESEVAVSKLVLKAIVGG